MFIPDGGIKFHGASNSSINATILINDDRTFQYHRASGVTAMWINMIDEGPPKFDIEFTVAEGQLTTAHLLNSAYLKTLTNQ